MDKVKVILIGAGMRGAAYVSEGKKYCPEMEVIAVADTNPVRCKHIQEMFGFSDEYCYNSAEEILEQPEREIFTIFICCFVAEKARFVRKFLVWQ